MLSKQDIQVALDADNQAGKLHRELMTVGECMDVELGSISEEDEKRFHVEHQNDNYESSL